MADRPTDAELAQAFDDLRTAATYIEAPKARRLALVEFVLILVTLVAGSISLSAAVGGSVALAVGALAVQMAVLAAWASIRLWVVVGIAARR